MVNFFLPLGSCNRKGKEADRKRTSSKDMTLASLLTQEEQLDFPGCFLAILSQVPVDHLTSLHRSLVLCAQGAAHLGGLSVDKCRFKTITVGCERRRFSCFVPSGACPHVSCRERTPPTEKGGGLVLSSKYQQSSTSVGKG